MSFAIRAAALASLNNAPTIRPDLSPHRVEGNLAYLKIGDIYQANDIYEHVRHGLGVRVVGGPYVAGISSDAIKPGDTVQPEHLVNRPRRYVGPAQG
jgi:hypothetical protein